MRTNKTIFFTLLFAFVNFVNAQNTWTGSVSTDWDNAGNWNTTGVTDRVPNSTDNVIIPNVSNDPVINIPGAVCGALTIESSGLLTSNNPSNNLTATTIDVQSGGELSIENGEITITGTSTIAGTLNIGPTGVYDANGTFDASTGTITMDGIGRLEVSGTVIALGTLDDGAGTVEYDGGTQNVLADDYFNLEIDQSGTKTAQGTITAAGTLTVQTGATYDLVATTTTVTGTSTIAGSINIDGSGVYDGNGNFAATGSITMDGTARLQLSAAGSGVSNLGTLDDGAGTVEYDGGTQNVLADDYFNLEIDQSGTKIPQGAVNVANDMTISNSATYLTANYTTTVSGVTSVSATLDVNNSSGVFSSQGGFSASGNINFSANGRLRFLNVSPTSLGTLDNTEGRVIYKNGATNVLADDYHNLQVVDGGTARTAQGDINVSGDFIIGSSAELNLGNNTLTITGDADINGILDFDNGGIFDANDEFDATGGTVQFTGSAGSLKLGGATVISLGSTLTEGTGTIEYDYAGNQTVISETYYNLIINNPTGTKTAGGALDIDGDLTVTSGELAMTSNNADVASGKTVDIDGTLSISSGVFTANGPTDIAGSITLSTGTYNADGEFNASGAVIFTDAGNLNLSNTVTSIGAFTESTSTVTYDGSSAQAVDADDYYNLIISGGATKTLQGATNVTNNLTVTASSTILDVNTRTLDVNGLSTISSSGKVTISTGTYNADGEMNCTATLEFTDAGALILSNTVTDLGAFIKGTSTVTYDESDAQTVDDVNYHHLILDQNGTKTASGDLDVDGNLTFTNSATLDMDDINNRALDLEGDFTITSGTFLARAGNHNVEGNWDCSGGTFASTSEGTITLESLSSRTITTGGSNSFYNLIIAGTVSTSGSNDIVVENLLTVNASKSLTVSGGNVMKLEDATVAGTLTVDATGSNATLDFTTATSAVLGVTGTIRLDGNPSNRAIVVSDDDSRIDFSVTTNGVFNADYATITYCDASGVRITGGGTQVISNVTFDYPPDAGTLLTVSSATDLPTQISDCIFGTTAGLSGVTSPTNVTADGTTDVVTFTNFSSSGSLAENAGDAATHEVDPSDKIIWFSGTYYSHDGGGTAPNIVGNWWSADDGTGFNPSDFTSSDDKFIVRSGDTYTGTDSWTVAGEIQVIGTLSTGANTITMAGNTDIDGTLTIPADGVYDANGAFDGTGSTINQDGTSRLQMSGTVTALGTLDDGAGTVEYDGGAQNVLADAYFNLEIDQSGTKTAQGTITAAGTLTVQTGATYDLVATTTRVQGESDINGTLNIDGSGTYDANGAFDASTGTINMDGSGRLQVSSTVASLGTLDELAGTVEYDGVTQDVLADGYYDLVIDKSGLKSQAAGTMTVAGNFTVQLNATYALDTRDITVTGTTVIQETLRISTGTFTANGATDINSLLTITGTGIYDANNAFTAESAAVTFTGAGFLKLGGATVTSLGNLTEGTGTVDYDYAGNQTVKTRSYYNLRIKGSGTKDTPNSATLAVVTVSNDFTIDNGVTFDLDAGNDNLVIEGDFLNNGTFTATGQQVTFSGASSDGETSSLINDATVDLIVNKSDANGGVTFQGASSFDEVTVSDGYLDIGAYTFTAGNTILIASDGVLKIPNSGTFNADGQLNTFGEIDFTGAGSQGDLICSSTSANTFGTLDAAVGTVTFDGGSSQAIPVETFFNLKNSNTNGLTMSGDATVNGELNLNVAGYITTGANTLTIGSGGSIVGAADDRHINVDNTSGFLAKQTTDDSPFSFPVGNGTILRPIRLTPSSPSGTTTFTLRYDDNRYSSGNISGGGFETEDGHISGYDDGGSGGAGSGYYYDISKTGSAAGASLFVSWTSAGQYGTGGATPANLDGISWGFWDGAKWDVLASSYTGTSTTGNIITDADNFSFTNRFFTLGSMDGSNYLPIDLLSFDGECIDNQANLEFVVASQVNNEYFTIKRSKNIIEWEEVGYINGGGTNNEEITYTWTDYSPISGVNYYKLFQTDIDGISESFAPIAVTCESKVEDYHIYPNPTNNRIAVEFELEFYQGDDIKLVLRDFKGSIVKSNLIELNRGYNYFEVDLSDIPNGIYTVGYLGTKNHIPLKRVIKL